MHWLIWGFLASLFVLLIAVAGMARHIWQERAKLRSMSSVTLEPADEPRLKLKH
jgi:hypothetical protein